MSNEPEAPEASPRGSRLARRILIALFATIALGAGFVGYVAYDGHRELQRELELLRASGAPEFPEQFEFPALPPGEDMVAWLASIGGATESFRIEDVPACRSIVSGPGFSRSGFELECDQALRDPRRIGALTECETAFLEARWVAEKPQLSIAAQVDRVAPIDWRSLWEKGVSDEAGLLLTWPAEAALQAERVLCHDAARRARRGDSTGALLRLRQGLSLIQRLGDSQTAPGFLTWVWLVYTWVDEGLIPAAQALPVESGLAEFLPELERIDVRSQLRSGLIRERAQGLRMFRYLQSSDGNSVGWTSSSSPFEWFTRAMWIDRDRQTYLRIQRETLAACEAGVDMAGLREVDRRLERLSESRLLKLSRPVTLMLCSRPSDFGWAALTLEANLALAGAALTAREQGTLAARAWLEGRKDPYSKGPLQARLGAEGILIFWSVGPDGREGPAEAGGVDDDIRVLVRPRGS